MELKDKLLVIAKSNVNVPGIVDQILDEVLEEAIKEAVKKTETVIDDLVAAALYQPLEDVIKAKVRKAWNSLA